MEDYSFKQAFTSKKEKSREQNRKSKIKYILSSQRKNVGIKIASQMFEGSGVENLMEEILPDSINIDNQSPDIVDSDSGSLAKYQGLNEKGLIMMLKFFVRVEKNCGDIRSDNEKGEEEQQNAYQNLYQNQIEFLKAQSLLPNPVCKFCKNKMKIGYQKKYLLNHCWRCYDSKWGFRKIRLFAANQAFSGFQDNFAIILQLLLQLVPLQVPKWQIQDIYDVSSKTKLKCKKTWYQALKLYYQKEQSDFQQLGSDGSVVEVDESCFRRKHHRGRRLQVEQKSLFGLTEHGKDCKRTFFFPVKKRNAETLIPIIRQYMSMKCKMIISDRLRAYSSLKNYEFIHKTINHKLHFVVSQRIQKQTKKQKKTKKPQSYQIFRRNNQHTNHRKQMVIFEKLIKKNQRKNIQFFYGYIFLIILFQYKGNIVQQSIEVNKDYIQTNIQNI